MRAKRDMLAMNQVYRSCFDNAHECKLSVLSLPCTDYDYRMVILVFLTDLIFGMAKCCDQ